MTKEKERMHEKKVRAMDKKEDKKIMKKEMKKSCK